VPRGCCRQLAPAISVSRDARNRVSVCGELGIVVAGMANQFPKTVLHTVEQSGDI